MATEVKIVFILKTVKFGFYVNMTQIEEQWLLVKLWDTPRFASQFATRDEAHELAKIALLSSKGENGYQLSDANHSGVDINVAIEGGFAVEEIIIVE